MTHSQCDARPSVTFPAAGHHRPLTRTKLYCLMTEARVLAYYGHTMRKQGSCLEKEIMQGTMPGARRLGRPRTAWMDNIKTWTGLSMEESIRMTEINGESTSMVWPTLGSRTAKEQNRTSLYNGVIEGRQTMHVTQLMRTLVSSF